MRENEAPEHFSSQYRWFFKLPNALLLRPAPVCLSLLIPSDMGRVSR